MKHLIRDLMAMYCLGMLAMFVGAQLKLITINWDRFGLWIIGVAVAGLLEYVMREARA